MRKLTTVYDVTQKKLPISLICHAFHYIPYYAKKIVSNGLNYQEVTYLGPIFRQVYSNKYKSDIQ